MNKFFELLNSSVGRKWLMALTGLFLCLFIIVHVSGNLALFKHDGGKAFNTYTVFMTTFFPIKVISYLNYATILLHALNGFYLVYRNKKARPVNYESKKNNGSITWSSRNMGLLGTVLFVFIIIHMANFWREFHFCDIPLAKYENNVVSNLNTVTKWDKEGDRATITNLNSNETVSLDKIPYEFTGPKHYSLGDGTEVVIVKDLYAEVEEAFESPVYSGFYVLAMLALAYHLIHGFQSSFQTLGIRKKRYESLIRGIGTFVFGIIIPFLFAAMPIYFLLFK